MFHGNVRFFVRGGNGLKKKARKLPPGEKRIHSREYRSAKYGQPVWAGIGALLLGFALFMIIIDISLVVKEDPSAWKQARIVFSHDEYIKEHRKGGSRVCHYLYSIDGQKFFDPYDLSLEQISVGDVLDIQYYHWYFKDRITTLRTSEEILVKEETAVNFLQSRRQDGWVLSVISGGVFLLIWLPLFIRSRRRYLKLKARYLKQQAYFKNQQP